MKLYNHGEGLYYPKGQAAIRHYANQPATLMAFQPGDLLCDCETLRNLREGSFEALERKRG